MAGICLGLLSLSRSPVASPVHICTKWLIVSAQISRTSDCFHDGAMTSACAQDASSAKGVSKVAPSLVPLQVFVTERDNTFASWKLLCNPLPSSLEHYQYLWPSESKVLPPATLCSLT